MGINTRTMRNYLVPKKVEVFVWGATQKRLPTRTELDKRGIDLHSIRCPICDDGLESVDHTLLFCKFAFDLWEQVYSWWGFRNVTNLSLNEILRGNGSVPMSSLGKMVWQAVEWIGAYHNWKNRNNKVFRGSSWNIPFALNEIQIRSFEWISHRLKKKCKLDWLSWINAIVYLRIV
ncbi:uncharacterized protein [Rutidosis leptorrhynchoides]|uniref:uncharacterized protein n=1 Tax=Rutidosis leptorrhynchoides TaxID=125765 RepID=UPI003A994B10